MLRSQSILFTPKNIGHMTVPNRFMRSATVECKCDDKGVPTDDLAKDLETLAFNKVGLVVPGALYVNSRGRGFIGQGGMAHSHQANGWRPVVEKVQKHGAKIMFQLSHSDNITMPRYENMTEQDIEEMIIFFRNAAHLAYISGADGVQLNAAHGYMLSSFMSPDVNKRTDAWGGSPDRNIRIVREIVNEIRGTTPASFAVSVKINGNEYHPGGVTPELAAEYAGYLKHDVDLFEISCSHPSKIYTIRTDFNEKALGKGCPKEARDELFKVVKQRIEGVPFTDLYNYDNAKVIRERNPKINIALVGGARKFDQMEKVVKEGVADMISMSRPFIRDPHLIKRFLMNTIDEPTCINCSACLFHMPTPIYCHHKAD